MTGTLRDAPEYMQACILMSICPLIHIMSCPTNEPDVDFFVLPTPKIDENHYLNFFPISKQSNVAK